MAPGPAKRPGWGDWCLAGLLGATALLTFWQILARHLGARLAVASPLINASYTEELARYLFIWTMLAGTIAALWRQEHLSLDLWGTRGGKHRRMALGLLGRISWATFGVVLAIGGLRVLRLQWTTTQLTTLGWPVGWVTCAVPFVGICFLAWAVSPRKAV